MARDAGYLISGMLQGVLKQANENAKWKREMAGRRTLADEEQGRGIQREGSRRSWKDKKYQRTRDIMRTPPPGMELGKYTHGGATFEKPETRMLETPEGMKITGYDYQGRPSYGEVGPTFEEKKWIEAKVKDKTSVINAIEKKIEMGNSFSHKEKAVTEYTLNRYNQIKREQGLPELEFIKAEAGLWGPMGDYWTLQAKRAGQGNATGEMLGGGQQTGQIITKGNQKYKIIRYDTDGEPLVELVK